MRLLYSTTITLFISTSLYMLFKFQPNTLVPLWRQVSKFGVQTSTNGSKSYLAPLFTSARRQHTNMSCDYPTVSYVTAPNKELARDLSR